MKLGGIEESIYTDFPLETGATKCRPQFLIPLN